MSGIFTIVGGLLISSSNYWLLLIGVLFFHIFAILDMSDGEVSRYRKQGGVNGHYLDWFMHFISSSSFMLGLFLASYSFLTHEILIIIGVLAVLFPILDKSVQTSGWTVICWTKLRDMKNSTAPNFTDINVEKNVLPSSLIKRRIKVRTPRII